MWWLGWSGEREPPSSRSSPKILCHHDFWAPRYTPAATDGGGASGRQPNPLPRAPVFLMRGPGSASGDRHENAVASRQSVSYFRRFLVGAARQPCRATALQTPEQPQCSRQPHS
jgi:hypothetical protein